MSRLRFPVNKTFRKSGDYLAAPFRLRSGVNLPLQLLPQRWELERVNASLLVGNRTMRTTAYLNAHKITLHASLQEGELKKQARTAIGESG